MTNKDRILQISKELGLSHIGSCLSILPILEEIYATKKLEDIVILDNAHAHLAHLVVREQYTNIWKEGSEFTKASNDNFIYPESLIKLHGIHCDRQAGCDASGGSLGHGLGIGIGMAIANPKKTIYIVVSDGSINEGSDWEALRLIKDLNIQNIEIYVNANGSTALENVDRDRLKARMEAFCSRVHFHYTTNGEGFEGVGGHYKVL